MSLIRLSKESANEELERATIARLAGHVEAKAGKGKVADWAQRDFDGLCEEIQQVTGQPISTTTLKSVLGRVQYKGLPYVHTLNQLASYVGAKSWQQFKHGPSTATPDLLWDETAIPATTKASGPLQPQRGGGWLYFLLGVLSAMLLAAIGYFAFAPADPTANLAGVLTAEMSKAKTLPRKVRFFYKGDVLPDNEVNFISYGNGRINLLSTDSNGMAESSALYEKPGPYKVKIFSGKKQVAVHPILIENLDWTGTFSVGNVEITGPVTIEKTGGAKVDGMKIMQQLGDSTSRYHTAFLRYTDFGVSADKMRLDMRLRATAPLPAVSDMATMIKLRGSNDDILIQLSAKPLRDANYVQISDYVMNKADKRQKNLLLPLVQWQDLRFSTNKSVLRLYAGERLLLEQAYKSALGNLLGIDLGFAGSGELQSLSIANGDKEIIYNETFGSEKGAK